MSQFENKISYHEEAICMILADLAHHMHPQVIERVQTENQKDYLYFKELFAGLIDIDHYLYDGSACVFPGVRRFVSNKGKKQAYNEDYKAIIDDNTFPRYIWCYVSAGTGYSSPTWNSTGLNQFELAHVYAHKESELECERSLFNHITEDLLPYGDFTCAANVALLPKGTVRPTDNSQVIKTIFYKRYIDLYGETTLQGRKGFKQNLVPQWYKKLPWNEPILHDGWQVRTDKLLTYRKKRVTKLIEKHLKN